jgi:ATP-dependent Clp protease ATP-binding subunit ClpA
MITFGTYLHAIMGLAEDEARRDGSATIEAQHLLLAIASGPDGAPRRVLTAAGLDHQAVRDALDREFARSLAAAGVSAHAFDLPPASNSLKQPGHGASIGLAIERAFAVAGHKKGLRPAHLLVGILQAEVGTVPRALALAGVDRAALAERARETVAGASG